MEKESKIGQRREETVFERDRWAKRASEGYWASRQRPKTETKEWEESWPWECANEEGEEYITA